MHRSDGKSRANARKEQMSCMEKAGSGSAVSETILWVLEERSFMETQVNFPFADGGQHDMSPGTLAGNANGFKLFKAAWLRFSVASLAGL